MRFGGGQARIEGGEAHHLTRVLRVAAGQHTGNLGQPQRLSGRDCAARKDLVTFSIVERLAAAEPLVRVTLYASLIRFERLELLLEKATELGIVRFAPLLADRSEKGLDRAAHKRMPALEPDRPRGQRAVAANHSAWTRSTLLLPPGCHRSLGSALHARRRSCGRTDS